MSNHIKDGGQAFPSHPMLYSSADQGEAQGMSLRDWFAGQALMGILAGHFADTVPHDDIGGGSEAAQYAYQYADAMLAAREAKS